MKSEAQLKLQAFLDGELSPSDALEVSARMERDPSAQALLADLRSVRSLLRQPEPATPVPASREFYWSRIAQEIGRQSESVSLRAETGIGSGWLRLILPALALVVLAVFIGSNMHYGADPLQVDAAAEMPAVETALASTDAATYRDASEGTTLVWFTDTSSEGLAGTVYGPAPN